MALGFSAAPLDGSWQERDRCRVQLGPDSKGTRRKGTRGKHRAGCFKVPASYFRPHFCQDAPNVHQNIVSAATDQDGRAGVVERKVKGGRGRKRKERDARQDYIHTIGTYLIRNGVGSGLVRHSGCTPQLVESSPSPRRTLQVALYQVYVFVRTSAPPVDKQTA